MNPDSLEFNGSATNAPETAEGELLPPDVVQKIESFEKREAEGVGSDDENIRILLVRSGVKPSTIIEVFGDFEEGSIKKFGADRQEILAREVAKVGDFLKSIGLHFKIKNPRMQELSGEDDKIVLRQEFVDVLVAASESALDVLDDGLKAGSHEKIGLALGFPKTAVDAYTGKGETMKRSDLPQHVRDSEIYPFINFHLSRDNWAEELKVVKAWVDTIKKNSPKLFNDTMEEFREGGDIEAESA